MKLYELAQEYQAVEGMAQDPEMDFQAVLDTLEGIAGEFEEKADSVACIVKILDYEAKNLKAEADVLSQRAKARTARADRLKEYLHQQMSLVGIKKIETARNVLQIRKTPAAVRFQDEGKFMEFAAAHPEYLRQKPPEADKTVIKEALKAGTQLPGVSLESGEAFSIR